MQKTLQKTGELLELDLWRGMAVIFMIANHAGFALLGEGGEHNRVDSAIIFIGSFAPVLFFLITGMGYGISLAHNGSKSLDGSTWYKAGILFLMDLLLRGGDITQVGWDFLGFIALSMILLGLLRASRAPVLLAAVLAVIVLGVRFVAGPLYDRVVPEAQQSALVQGLLGLSSIEGVSYWFAPWLVYPLAGFVVGYYFALYRGLLLAHRKAVMTGLGVTALVFTSAALAMKMQDMIFFRWGTMSIAYFVVSLGVLAWSALVAWALVTGFKSEKLPRLLAQRGVSSLAIVPIHYALLYYSEKVLVQPLGTLSFVFYLTGLVAVSYILARYINHVAKVLSESTTSPALVAIVGAAGPVIVLVIGSMPMAEPLRAFHIFSLELVLCLLLPLRVVPRRLRHYARSNKSGVPE